MNKISSSLLALALFAGPLAGAASAQQSSITVNLANLAPDIAAQLGINANDVPTYVNLSFDAAVEACGLDSADFGDATSCDAFSITGDILAAVEAYDDDGDDGTNGDGDGDDGEGANPNPNPNSARDFAPGQQDGPANEFAPGRQDGPANEFAPGQLKKDAADETDDDLDPDDQD